MSAASHEVGVYLHLAQASQRRRRPLIRDRMLVLAGAAAANQAVASLADYCRAEVLKHNPHHLVGHWPTLIQALMDDEFIAFLRQLRRRYPLEKAERLLETLGIETRGESETYYNTVEYAAAILGVDVGQIESQ